MFTAVLACVRLYRACITLKHLRVTICHALLCSAVSVVECLAQCALILDAIKLSFQAYMYKYYIYLHFLCYVGVAVVVYFVGFKTCIVQVCRPISLV